MSEKFKIDIHPGSKIDGMQIGDGNSQTIYQNAPEVVVNLEALKQKIQNLIPHLPQITDSQRNEVNLALKSITSPEASKDQRKISASSLKTILTPFPEMLSVVEKICKLVE